MCNAWATFHRNPKYLTLVHLNPLQPATPDMNKIHNPRTFAFGMTVCCAPVWWKHEKVMNQLEFRYINCWFKAARLQASGLWQARKSRLIWNHTCEHRFKGVDWHFGYFQKCQSTTNLLFCLESDEHDATFMSAYSEGWQRHNWKSFFHLPGPTIKHSVASWVTNRKTIM